MEQKTEWIKRWAGSYTFISCSYWGPQYSRILKRILGMGLDSTLFIHKKGTVSFFVKDSEFKKLGKFLADKTIASETEAIELLSKLKQSTDQIMGLMDKLESKILTLSEHSQFLSVFEKHLAFHCFMKKTVDFLSPEILKKLLPKFQDARIYSEAVYSRTEQFFRSLAKSIADKEEIDPELITCLMQEELEDYIKTGAFPSEDELRERFIASIILFEDGKIKLVTGPKVKELEDKFFSVEKDEIKGTVAFRGKVKGKCRIISDPFKEHDFDKGDILVTGMTRPEFISFMEKASAIVTDAGGLLCHAAISAREMKIPCVVGTEKATRMFKDGELIEVDAESGIVRKLSKE
jgi:phosphohistidine swiveling domain-containing protein